MFNRNLLHPRDIFEIADVLQLIDRISGDRKRLRKQVRRCHRESGSHKSTLLAINPIRHPANFDKRNTSIFHSLDFRGRICSTNEYPMNRNNTFFSSPIVAITLLLLAAFAGCASYDAKNKESLLIAAGFKARTPSTAKQQAMFNSMTPYKLERRLRNGKVLYAYADKQNNVVYVGGENEYQQYKQLALKQSIAEDQLEAAQINEEASMYNDFGPYWGPWNIWW